MSKIKVAFTDDQLLELKQRLEKAIEDNGGKELSKDQIAEINDDFALEITESNRKQKEIKGYTDPMMPSEKPNK